MCRVLHAAAGLTGDAKSLDNGGGAGGAGGEEPAPHAADAAVAVPTAKITLRRRALATGLDVLGDARELADRFAVATEAQRGGRLLSAWFGRVTDAAERLEKRAAKLGVLPGSSEPTRTAGDEAAPTGPSEAITRRARSWARDTSLLLGTKQRLGYVPLPLGCDLPCGALPPGHTRASWCGRRLTGGGRVGSGGCPVGHTHTSWRPRAARGSVMVEIARRVRCEERSVEFIAALARARRAVSGESGYSESNFAYGSTPLATWWAVTDPRTFADHPEAAESLGAATAKCVDGGGTGSTYTVMGSSLGLLLLAGAVLRGWRCVGVEILPHLAAFSQQLADEYLAGAGHGGSAAVVEGDMLAFDGLRNSALVLLTSQCWDQALLHATYDKLAAELPAGAVVVDYLPHLPARHGEAFEKLAGVRLPVSWNDSHEFVLSVRKGAVVRR